MDIPSSHEELLTTEIERKFIVDALPEGLDLEPLNGKKIYQGYLANTPESIVRIRQKGDEYILTFKEDKGGHAAECVELECEISEEQFTKMWPGTQGRRLEKTRYEIAYGNHTIELDVFEGVNQGHMLAEVEFGSTSDADMFQPPEWFGVDVTSQTQFANASIAEQGFPSWQLSSRWCNRLAVNTFASLRRDLR